MTAPTEPVLLSDLSLAAGGTTYDVQLSNAQVQSETSTSTVVTFTGTYSPPAETAFTLHLEGFQDWGDVDGFCDFMWNAALAPDTPVAFTLDIGGKRWEGNVRARFPQAGGAAGDPFAFTMDLPIQGIPGYGDKPAGP